MPFEKEVDKLDPQIFMGYNMSVIPYSEATRIPVVENCFAFMFTNIGDTIATVNGMIIHPSATPLTALGDSRSVSGHKLDTYKGNITLAFVQPIGANPLVEVVQLFYVNTYSKNILNK